MERTVVPDSVVDGEGPHSSWPAFIVQSARRASPRGLVDLLTAAGIEVHSMPACEPAEDEAAELLGKIQIQRARARLGYEMTPGMVGCAMSHRRVYEKLSELDVPGAYVFEDDVEVAPGASLDVLRTVARVADVDMPRIVQLWTRGVRLVEPRTVATLAGASVYRFISPPGQTAAYVINRAAASLALDGWIDASADWPSWASRVEFLTVCPWVVVERPGESLIGVGWQRSGRGRRWNPERAPLPGVAGFDGLPEYAYRVLLARWEGWLWRVRGRPSAGQCDLWPATAVGAWLGRALRHSIVRGSTTNPGICRRPDPRCGGFRGRA